MMQNKQTIEQLKIKQLALLNAVHTLKANIKNEEDYLIRLEEVEGFDQAKQAEEIYIQSKNNMNAAQVLVDLNSKKEKEDPSLHRKKAWRETVADALTKQKRAQTLCEAAKEKCKPYQGILDAYKKHTARLLEYRKNLSAYQHELLRCMHKLESLSLHSVTEAELLSKNMPTLKPTFS